MKISTMFKKISKYNILAIFFWLGLWQLLSMKLGQEILLVSPVSAIKRLLELFQESFFWISIKNSFIRVSMGFLLGLILGSIFAVIATVKNSFRILLEPLMQTIQAVPVVSFIILCLIWVSSENLSVLISFMMCLPIIYRNILIGIRGIPKELEEMAKVFRVKKIKKIRYIYLSELSPYIKSACNIAIGLCWKSGMAAEVIAMPRNSIGENLYQSKVYLNTADLFAWTITVVILSILFKTVVIKLLDKLLNRLEISS